MSGAIVAFLSKITGNKALIAAILAVIPVTEIKGSILYAAASEGGMALPVLAAYSASVLLAAALSVLVPKTMRLARRVPVIGKISAFLTDRLSSKAAIIARRAEGRGDRRENSLLFGVFAFVAIPLPLTGIWAGALLASILGIKARDTFFALAAGNFVSGGVVLTVALLAGEKAGLVLDLFLLLAAALVCSALLTAAVRRRKKRKSSE